MNRYSTTLYLALWNVLCLGLLAIGWAYGMIQDVFLEDASKMSTLCAALLLIALINITYKTIQLDRMIGQQSAADLEDVRALPSFLKAEVFLCLGVCGTVIGLSLFAKHMAIDASQATAEGIAATMSSMKTSLQTAFHATLVGIVCKLWVEMIAFIQDWKIRRIGTLETAP